MTRVTTFIHEKLTLSASSGTVKTIPCRPFTVRRSVAAYLDLRSVRSSGMYSLSLTDCLAASGSSLYGIVKITSSLHCISIFN